MVYFDTDLRDLDLPTDAADALERVILARAAMMQSGDVVTDAALSAMACRAIARATGQRFAVMLHRYDDPAGPVCVVAALTDVTADRRPG